MTAMLRATRGAGRRGTAKGLSRPALAGLCAALAVMAVMVWTPAALAIGSAPPGMTDMANMASGEGGASGNGPERPTANATSEAVARSVADSVVKTLADSIAARGVQPQGARKLVLLLNSYEQGMGRVREITDTIERILAPADNNITLRVENLDSKRVSTPEYLDAFAALLALKYAGRTPALILTSDDDALDFLEKWHAALFPGVPVLFCGVNHYHDSLATAIPQLSGVLSTFSARETAETLLALHPETRHIHLVNDHTETGRAVA